MSERRGSPLSMDTDNVTLLATGSNRQIQPLRRAATIGDISNSATYPLRRNRSRQFSRSSTDTLATLPTINEKPAENHDEQSHWHAFSLVFVALPALAGLLFENGSSVMTDLLLLGLGCLFLYWSVKWPWQWYHAAQAKTIIELDNDLDSDYAIIEHNSDEEKDDDDDEDNNNNNGGDDNDGPAKSVLPKGDQEPKTAATARAEKRELEACRSLRTHEIIALATCFLSPMAVAYLLHALRPYLSRPSGGVVSNSNLTLFILAAEVRPFLHLFKMIEARTLHLQRIVAIPSASSALAVDNEQLVDIMKRVEQLESKKPAARELNGKDTKTKASELEMMAITENMKQSIQPQLDALNRAVRRYEKRATMQSVVTEARMRDLESRLKDALALAAAASRMSQKPGLIASAVERLNSILSGMLGTASRLLWFPFRLILDVYRFVFGTRRKREKPRSKRIESPPRTKGKVEKR